MNNDQRDQMLGGYISAAFFAVGAPAALLVRPGLTGFMRWLSALLVRLLALVSV